MKLKADIRKEIGKKYAKKFRDMGKVPAELYGHGEGNIHLLIEEKDLALLKKEGGTITLDIPSLTAGRKGNPMVIIKEVQYDPTSSKIFHIDFQHLHKGEKVHVKVPIVLEGEAIGVEHGGVLEHILNEIEVETLPRDIPEEFKIDISDLDVGHALHLKDMDTGECRPLEDLERTIVTILVPKIVEEEKPEVAEEIEEEEKEEGEEKEVEEEKKEEPAKE